MGVGMEVVIGKHAGQSHVEIYRSISRVLGDTLMTPPSRCAAMVWVEPVFLESPYHGTPREGSGLLSMQPAVCTPWCCCC